MSRYLGIDIETKSSADLGKVGVYRYVEDPDFAVMLFGYAWRGEEKVVIDLAQGEEIPAEILAALTDPSVSKTAWNANFERTCMAKHLNTEMPACQWLDTMITASVCGLPMSLGGCGQALGMPEDKAKDREGKALIRFFCKPYSTKKDPTPRWHEPKDYPEKWEKFKDYNGQDVVAEGAIRDILEQWVPGEVEHRAWVMDQNVNDRGVRVDLTLARNAVAIDAANKADLTEQAVALTGMANPNSVAQVKAWLLEQEGLEVPSLNKKEVADVVARLESDKAKDFMALRAELSKTSTAKYSAMTRAACEDEHVRGCFQFCGAGRTGRWAGRLVQLQNLSKNKMKDLDLCRGLVRAGDLDGLRLLYGNVSSCLSELVRTALIPEQGHRFIVCDYSAIEARVLSWIAGEEWALDEFRGDGLIYEATGARMFGVPKLSIAKGGENNHLRQSAKTAELACIAEGQLVLTDAGLVPIEQITSDMRVWDGSAWVEHQGLLCKGLRPTVFAGGIELTTDHKILTGKGMVPCGESEGLNWADVRVRNPVESHKEREPVAVRGGRSAVPVYDLLNAGPQHRFCIYDPAAKALRCVSNCGYGGGMGAMKAFGADKMGMSDEDILRAVDLWREAHPNVQKLWKALERAAIRCVVHGTPQTTTTGVPIQFKMEKGILWMTLPSGRRIAYFGARYGEGTGKYTRGKKVLSYMGQDQQTRKWVRIETFSGKITENLVQATARDCLRDALIALDEAGFRVVAHIHDEVIITEPIGGRSLADVAEIMGRDLPWAPGLPLRGDGYECPYYIKD